MVDEALAETLDAPQASAPLSPDRRQVERPPPSLQITSNGGFLGQFLLQVPILLTCYKFSALIG